ncbi:hypothetical protein [Nonomuraea lactucae]|uniref:hypothetical protein n=1 Tax=Nonomuraea lactucae TaxID=2249762 RepID=UPI000DE42317|nr:hypothetical protein [Nonomuraea lactucae]
MVSLLAAIAVMGAGAAAPTSALAAPSTGVHRADVSAFRDFDAVTTVNERNVWKHMALIGDKYAIFNDSGLIEGPTSITQKWPFLPEQFTHDVDAAGISFSGPGFRWRHTWTKGNQAIIFEDSGIVSGPFAIPTPYDGISDVNVGSGATARVQHLAVRGGFFTFFFGLDFRIPTSALADQAFLPERFRSDLDDVSIEYESSGTKISYYKDNERIIFSDRGRVVELVNLDVKWPFLNAWRTTG